MSGISFTGIGSGLPVGDIVSGLVEAERTPYNQRANEQGVEITTQISANGALKDAMSQMLSSLEALQDEDNYNAKKTSGSDDFISVSSDEEAQVGSYNIEVNQLAQAQKTISDGYASSTLFPEGVLEFATASQIADGAGDIAFSITTEADDTLEDIRDKINDAEDNDSVIATIITESNGEQRLVMSAADTGLDNAITVTGNNVDGTALDAANPLNNLVSTNLTELDSAEDAQITIDGTVALTSSTNEFANAIDGITITAKKEHNTDIANGDIDSPSKATIAEDNGVIESQLSSFVEAYTSFQGLVDQLGQAGGEDENAGVMAGDSLLRSVTSRIRNMLSDSFGSDGLSLTQIGVGTPDDYLSLSEEERDKFSVDSDEFQDIFGDDPDSIKDFFIGTDDEPGFAASLGAYIEDYTKDQGLIDSRIDGYERQEAQLDEDVAAFALKMDAYEARLYSQYNAMDALVASMNNTSTFLTSSLANLPGVVSSS